MSVRAYKIITKEIEKNPSFNLWHDGDLITMLNSQGEYTDLRNDDGVGNLEYSVASIKYALKHYKWEENDYRKEQLKNDIESLSDDDWIEYECF